MRSTFVLNPQLVVNLRLRQLRGRLRVIFKGSSSKGGGAKINLSLTIGA